MDISNERCIKEIKCNWYCTCCCINDADKAVPLAKALVEGGIPCAEVTFRTAAAEEAIKRMAEEVPELIVGAGTVLTKEQADKAVAAGSKFLVSPG